MPTPTAISRRLQDSFRAFMAEDSEHALIHLFPAIDKTAKRRRPKAGVGERIKGFLADEQRLISLVAFNNILVVSADGVTFPDAIYKFGRTAIAHEGELDARLRITNGSALVIGQVWELPRSYIAAMGYAVLFAPENSDEQMEGNPTTELLGERRVINDLWGKRPWLVAKLTEKWTAEGGRLPLEL